MDETGIYYTEWSKSEREKQILYINIYMEFRQMDQQPYVQGSKGDTDVRNRLLDSAGEGEGGMI